jgi:hypothetical protein
MVAPARTDLLFRARRGANPLFCVSRRINFQHLVMLAPSLHWLAVRHNAGTHDAHLTDVTCANPLNTGCSDIEMAEANAFGPNRPATRHVLLARERGCGKKRRKD